jgi:hypothetical protein
MSRCKLFLKNSASQNNVTYLNLVMQLLYEKLGEIEDVQTNLEAILNPKSFAEIENRSAQREPLQP